jgi:hypothetical protein
VEYGTAEQYNSDRYPFQNYVEDQTYVTDHVITFTNLSPNLKYYYQVRSNQNEILEAVSPVQIIDTITTTYQTTGGNSSASNTVTLRSRARTTSSSATPTAKTVVTVASTEDTGLIPCGFDKNGDGMVKDLNSFTTGIVDEECHFDDFIILIGKITTFLIILGTSVATLAFA